MSIQWRGRVDPAYMAEILGAPEGAVLEALAGAGQVFLDPADGEWKTTDDYLSGNVKAKLKQAVLSGSTYQRNIDALEQVHRRTCHRRHRAGLPGRCGFRPLTSRRSSSRSWNLMTARWGYSAEPAPGR
ncbi:MAG: hypothetical protein IPN75_18350 [Dechloromonas sp.]|uniref:Uncharacterized protein n=1 Tax=Candidatus Dechloromonas phosphorivorans TaxID=2899244 RepID=A0A9D7LU86_9RHOO|nr:hypothetical protein [Candidatus Dechloromonas phosphorivorans]